MNSLLGASGKAFVVLTGGTGFADAILPPLLPAITRNTKPGVMGAMGAMGAMAGLKKKGKRICKMLLYFDMGSLLIWYCVEGETF